MLSSTWFEWIVVGGVVLSALAGVFLTLLTLPGIWLMILVACLAQWWSLSNQTGIGTGVGGGACGSSLYEAWTLIAAVILGAAAEFFEFAASAMGAKKVGGSKRGAVASMVGGVIGAVVGSFLMPIVGTILGAAVGAGGAALLVEKHHVGKSWEAATKIGTGAFVGRLLATVVKTAIAAVISIMLIIGVLI